MGNGEREGGRKEGRGGERVISLQRGFIHLVALQLQLSLHLHSTHAVEGEGEARM